MLLHLLISNLPSLSPLRFARHFSACCSNRSSFLYGSETRLAPIPIAGSLRAQHASERQLENDSSPGSNTPLAICAPKMLDLTGSAVSSDIIWHLMGNTVHFGGEHIAARK